MKFLTNTNYVRFSNHSRTSSLNFYVILYLAPDGYKQLYYLLH